MMENSWQSKCTSSWSSIPSSSQNPQQVSRNQMEMNASRFIQQYDSQELRSVDMGNVRELRGFNSSNLLSCKSGKPELGVSFLSLLSGPSLQLQHGIQPMQSSTTSIDPGILPIQNNNIVFNGGNYGAPLEPIGFLSQQQGISDMRTGTDHFPGVPPCAASTSNGSCFPEWHGIHQMPNVTWNSVINQTNLHPIVRGNEIGTDTLYPRQGWLSSLNLVDGQHNSTNTQASLKVPSVAISAASSTTSSISKGGLRVFCLATNGELLHDSKGLLAVRCLCHGLQMSISKFCEHSGSCIVNPGDAVRLESGETVAQWRRRYFPKYGIRIPDDSNGWDWPEKNPATVGLLNCKKATARNISKNSGMLKVVDSCVASPRNGQHWSNFMSPNNSHKKESNVNAIHDGTYKSQQRNAQQGGNTPPKSFSGSAQVALPAPADVLTMNMVTSSQPKRSDKAREGSGYQSISDYIAFLTKGGFDPLVAKQSVENFNIFGRGSDVSGANSMRDLSIIERDNSSSNIELRLGQPSQQGYNLEGSIVSPMQSEPFDTCRDSQKLLLQDHIFCNAAIPKLTMESGQNLWCYPTNASNSHRVNESKLFRHNAPADSAQVGQFKGDSAKSSHMFFSHSSTLSERDIMSPSRKTMTNYSGTYMSTGPLGESHGINGPTDISRNRGDGTPAQLTNNIPCHLNRMDRGKNSQHIEHSCSYTTEKSKSFLDNYQMGGPFPVPGVSSNHLLSSGSTMKGKQWCHSSRVQPDASYISDQSNPHGKASSVQGSTGSVLPLSEVSAGFPSSNLPSLMQLLSNKKSVDVSPHFSDENLRLLAMRHTLDASKLNHAIKPQEMERRPEGIYSSLNVEMQKSSSTLHSVASEERKVGPHFTIRKDTAEFAVNQHQAFSKHYVDGNFRKVADETNWCNLSTPAHGVSFLSKDNDIRNRISQDSLTAKLALPSNSHFGRIHNTLNPVPSIFDDMVQENRANTLNQYENLGTQHLVQNDCHASQWRDVPNKRIQVSNGNCVVKPTEVFDASKVDTQAVKTARKRSDRNQEAVSLNEQQMSNVYSGCSAPAVTELTVEVNMTDSCTVDAGNDRYVNEHVVDEGSGIERCWSSDDALDSERSTETVFHHKLDLVKGGKCSSYIPKLYSHGHIDNIRCGSSHGPKKVRKRVPARCSIHKSINETQPPLSNLRYGKKKKTIKWKKLDASFPASGLSSVQYDSPKSNGDTESHSCSSRGTQILSKSNHGLMKTCGVYSNQPSGLKRKHLMLSSAKTLSRKIDLCELVDHHKEIEDDCSKRVKDDVNHLKISRPSSKKKSKQCWARDVSRQFLSQDISQRDARKVAKFNPTGSAKIFSINDVDTFDRKPKPVVCGKFGIISNGKLGEDQIKPPKIVSLNTILKTTKRCSTTAIKDHEHFLTVHTKKTGLGRSCERYDGLSVLEDEETETDSEDYNNVLKNEEEETSIVKTKNTCCSEDDMCVAELSMSGNVKDGTSSRMLKHSSLNSGAPLKSRFKEARKRSLYELAEKGKELCSSSHLPTKSSKRPLLGKLKSLGKSCLKNVDRGSKCRSGELSRSHTKKSAQEQKSQAFVFDSDAFCSVCGSSKKDHNNCLLECSSCLIRVHQACYGVSRVPKGRWCCRPCRVDSKDNVCVLCGYEGGAMTQALKSRNIVKGLLEAWIIGSETKAKKFYTLSGSPKDDLKLLETFGSEFEVDSKSLVIPVAEEPPNNAMLSRDLVDKEDVVQISDEKHLQVHNSITAGVVDLTIKQWVHMVCGLWTPGTRCPNVDTMSAFDVSGVSPPKNVVCSICNRSGGSGIKCRVLNCSVHFHPWCAHQKGLLQSEVEGVDNDKVGFYGRCVHHATDHGSDSVHRIDTDLDTLGGEEFSCARTEGYKGRKKDGFRHKLLGRSNVNGKCLVPQEQIDAWLHINGQKSCIKGVLKPPTSEIEHDCRKEYARYKQAKAWKNLVVYKSGIHGLGLYTSQFISRAAMVVEYVGEIVGLRVADKREVEYQSGRKLQYKGACYFFRIDKEHIIDATRKGGIARFVNHSCLPNCAAKVISVRNEKKVVFFAERDIYPGEEVTYDYHFNHEDEGEKIPCFCNSKNCRRYLN
ncbi:Histone-lysine n-methyltransferase trr [Thalictrum thalictroides]|uniref:Histone-lysine n-methyltransferase trr n=1 Tax=Thalictrum thalictroides TaxID=46969 RepID=A0A7J6WLW6_THATH|nr:Histone-lysine n-methyltransferase trr [Thalictrum thalictroides]